jgi:hypothetical protein
VLRSRGKKSARSYANGFWLCAGLIYSSFSYIPSSFSYPAYPISSYRIHLGNGVFTLENANVRLGIALNAKCVDYSCVERAIGNGMR